MTQHRILRTSKKNLLSELFIKNNNKLDIKCPTNIFWHNKFQSMKTLHWIATELFFLTGTTELFFFNGGISSNNSILFFYFLGLHFIWWSSNDYVRLVRYNDVRNFSSCLKSILEQHTKRFNNNKSRMKTLDKAAFGNFTSKIWTPKTKKLFLVQQFKKLP